MQLTAENTSDWLGRTAEREIPVTADLIDRFVLLSGDNSAIHVDDAAARARGFRGRVAHGMLLGSLVSAVIGTELPGHIGVLQEA
ncbi:MAG: acyl dehydratase, partial [Acidobacteria bacterium]|nr:acyl dehydratase [Acidobacteriota bacterium]